MKFFYRRKFESVSHLSRMFGLVGGRASDLCKSSKEAILSVCCWLKQAITVSSL